MFSKIFQISTHCISLDNIYIYILEALHTEKENIRGADSLVL